MWAISGQRGAFFIAVRSRFLGYDAEGHRLTKTLATRSNDANRAVAAYVARRRFGYRAREVAQALGYRSHGSVRNALLRVEDAPSLLKTIDTICRKLSND